MTTQSTVGVRQPAPRTAIADGPLVMGIEANGTAVCAVVADAAGHPVGVGRAGAATPTAYPIEALGERLRDAVRMALGDLDPGRLGAVVLGLAGISRLTPHTSGPVLERTWHRI